MSNVNSDQKPLTNSTPSSNVDRRTFLKRSAVSLAAGAVVLSGAHKISKVYADSSNEVAVVLDITKCIGCEICLKACRGKNSAVYPEPQEDIMPYWPQKSYEDWSDQRDRTDRLTPYNWLYIQKLQLQHDGKNVELNIPRRCMHCDNPPCANLCPFGIIERTEEGAVNINHDFCFGGAKCRDVCPWSIPQRQAGVGLYLKVAPKYAGGGVMYKCDLCQDRLQKGEAPACVAACPEGTMTFGPRTEMLQFARQRAAEMNGYLYGAEENEGTATFYISPVPFDVIDEAISKNLGEGHTPMEPGIENPLTASSKFAILSFLIAPIAALGSAAALMTRKMKGDE